MNSETLTPDRHVSAHYSTTSGHCRFSGCLYTYVTKRKLFGLGLKKEAVNRLFAMVKHGEGVYHFQCFVNHESTEAEYIYNMKSFSGAEQAKDIGTYKFVFMIKFEDGDIEPLRLMCASERERQQWVGEINDIIRDIVEENSALSNDSGFGSGSSASKEHTGHRERDYDYVPPFCSSLTQLHSRKPQAKLEVYSPKTNRRRDKRAPVKESPQEIGCYVNNILTDATAVNDDNSEEGSGEDKLNQMEAGLWKKDWENSSCLSHTQQDSRRLQARPSSPTPTRRTGNREQLKRRQQKTNCNFKNLSSDTQSTDDNSSNSKTGSDEDINNGDRTQTTAKHLSNKATQQQERPKPAPRPKARTHIGHPAPVKESQQETYCKSEITQVTAKHFNNKAIQQKDRPEPAARPKTQRHRGLPVQVKESQQETYCKNSEHTNANAVHDDGSITTLRPLQITDDDRAQTTAKHLSNKDTRQQERSKPAARPKANRYLGLPVQVNESQEETYCNMTGIQAQADTAHDYDSITALKQLYIPTDEDRLLSNMDRETADGQESTYINLNLVRQRVQQTDDERSWLSCRGPQTESEDDAHAEHRQDKIENDSSE